MSETFSIQFVSQITGINGHTIRAWEKRYKAVIPKRDKNKRRLYTNEDIERLKRIHDLCSLGNSVSDIAILADEELERLHEKYFEKMANGNGSGAQEVVEPIDINLTLQNLMMAIHHYKLDIISHELEKAQGSLSAREFALNLIVPLLMEIGMHVQDGLITVGMEHAITAIIRFHLGQMIFKQYQRKKHFNYHVVLATPEKEFSDFSIMISALLCSHYNLKFTYLGVNMTPYALADATKQIGADLTILNVSRSFIIDHAETFKNYLKNFLSKSDPKLKLWVTGVNQKTESSYPVDFYPTQQTLDQALSQLIG